jgi:hypothetical protein
MADILVKITRDLVRRVPGVTASSLLGLPPSNSTTLERSKVVVAKRGPSGAPRRQEITEMQYQVQREDVARSSRSGLKTWQASSYRHNEGIDRLNTTAQDLPRLTRQALIDLPQSA